MYEFEKIPRTTGHFDISKFCSWHQDHIPCMLTSEVSKLIEVGLMTFSFLDLLGAHWASIYQSWKPTYIISLNMFQESSWVRIAWVACFKMGKLCSLKIESLNLCSYKWKNSYCILYHVLWLMALFLIFYIILYIITIYNNHAYIIKYNIYI